MGGPSKEREISFAGGRTVFDNLDKDIFEPVPIFIDVHANPILLDWQYVYKGSIRDFYPPVSQLPIKAHGYQIYEESIDTQPSSGLAHHVGTPLQWYQLSQHIDVAYLALHGLWGEDGKVQALLEHYELPYTGCGVMASSIGIDKRMQKLLMSQAGWNCPDVQFLHRQDLDSTAWDSYLEELSESPGFPLVIRPATQGSSLGVSIINEESTATELRDACELAFFRQRLEINDWVRWDLEAKKTYIQNLADIRVGIGMPVLANGQLIEHPSDLHEWLDGCQEKEVTLENLNDEEWILLEEFVDGIEFSSIVITDQDGKAVCLPPTEIVKDVEVFDYRSKYLPGMARKRTPILLDQQSIENIQSECCRLFEFLGFQVYARIDGFIKADGTIYLNDPNTTSGMLPSSFFFHQAAEIGLGPKEFITYIVHSSLQSRCTARPSQLRWAGLLESLDLAISQKSQAQKDKTRVAVIFGGFSSERHISLESGRNIYEKLASSQDYLPIPILLSGSEEAHRLHILPIRLMLKDNVDDIVDALPKTTVHPIADALMQDLAPLLAQYKNDNSGAFAQMISYEKLAELVDFAFIALHGRPGEDGAIQKELEQVKLPYNGSGVSSSQTTINKYETLRILREHGFITADQLIIQAADYQSQKNSALSEVQASFQFPLIAKPVDDGCSSAVKKISSTSELATYLDLLFGESQDEIPLRQALGLAPNEEFPRKNRALIESLISSEDASQFMEITVGVLSNLNTGQLEVLEPSEALSSGDVLSLEEKFLAGEGQNITPARLGANAEQYGIIVQQIKDDLARACAILDVTGYARIDAFVRIKENLDTETIIIEVNSLPGMTPATCIFHQAALKQLSPLAFIDHIIQHGLHRPEEALASA